MLIRSPHLGPVPIAFDPVAVGAKQLVGARDTSKRGVFQVCTNAIEMGKTHTMAGSQFRATTASHMVDLLFFWCRAGVAPPARRCFLETSSTVP